MIYEKHLEQELLKYCEASGIQLRDGVVPAKYVGQVNQFLSYRMRFERNKNREIEETSKLKINPFLEAIIKSQVESPLEEYMMGAFVEHGIFEHCQTQFQIGTKRVDFAFPIAKLVVECDGRQYHVEDGELMEKDQKRDIYLARKGWVVKHFDGLMIRRNIQLCMEEILAYLKPFLAV